MVVYSRCVRWYSSGGHELGVMDSFGRLLGVVMSVRVLAVRPIAHILCECVQDGPRRRGVHRATPKALQGLQQAGLRDLPNLYIYPS